MKQKLNVIIDNMLNKNTREPLIVQAVYKQDLFDEIQSGRAAIRRARKIALFSVLCCLASVIAVAALGIHIASASEPGAIPGCIASKSEMIAEGKPLPKVIHLTPETSKKR